MKYFKMKKLKHILIYILLGYAALYATIWLHELGHAIVFHHYDCKENVYDFKVPFHFGNANPYPINWEKAKSLSLKQDFYVSIAGVVVNIVLGLLSWLVLFVFGQKMRSRWLKFFITTFAIAHFSEACSYLTVSNVYAVSDMIGVQAYDSAIQIPLFFVGLILVYILIFMIKNAPVDWRRGLTTFTLISVLMMGGLRLFFTLNA